MAFPTVYTESDLADHMVTALGTVAETLGWSNQSSEISLAVNYTLQAYGVDDVADATDTEKLRVLADVEAWRAAKNATTPNFAFSTDGQRFERQQMHEQIRAAFRDAERRARALGVGRVGSAVPHGGRTPWQAISETEF